MSRELFIIKLEFGYWIDVYLELGCGLILLDDCVLLEFYEKECEYIFKKNWLYVGWVEQLLKLGSYFICELKVLDIFVLIVKGNDEVVRVFYNICFYCGNKLMWKDDFFLEIEGIVLCLYCCFYGWCYNFDGILIFFM